MSFAVVMEGVTLIAFLVVIAGGKQKREQGWKVLTGLLLLAGMVQCAGMALIVSLWAAMGVADGANSVCRLICTTTTIGSFLAGGWIRRGSCVRSAGA